MKTFSVGWVFEKLAEQEGLNVETRNIDDVCFGFTITSDKTFIQVAREHSAVYNYQIVDGDPILLKRREVNDDLVIDFDINETDDDCIRRAPGPTVMLSRIEPSSLPRQIEIQYVDPDRDYAVATQTARHPAAPRTNTQISIAIDFVISAQQARDMAFDLLYRLWAQQLRLKFEHRDMRIEPGDTVRLTTSRGVFTCLVTKSTLRMPARTNVVEAIILLTSKGADITAPVADPFSVKSVPVLTEDDAEWIAEDDIPILTEG